MHALFNLNVWISIKHPHTTTGEYINISIPKKRHLRNKRCTFFIYHENFIRNYDGSLNGVACYVRCVLISDCHLSIKLLTSTQSLNYSGHWHNSIRFGHWHGPSTTMVNIEMLFVNYFKMIVLAHLAKSNAKINEVFAFMFATYLQCIQIVWCGKFLQATSWLLSCRRWETVSMVRCEFFLLQLSSINICWCLPLWHILNCALN